MFCIIIGGVCGCDIFVFNYGFFLWYVNIKFFVINCYVILDLGVLNVGL